MNDRVGDVWHFTKPEGVLVIEVVSVDERAVQYRTRWVPDTVAVPRLCGPVLKVEWHRWRKRGELVKRGSRFGRRRRRRR